MYMKRTFIFAMFIVLVFASLPAFASMQDSDVKGLWLTCPVFPNDAKLVEFEESSMPWDNDLSEVTYTRLVDGKLSFTIRRQTIEESELQKPEDVNDLIEMRVNNDMVDEDRMKANANSIKFNAYASELSELYTYPCATAEYMTGQNEDARQNVSLFIFTDIYCFLVEVSVAADWAEDYENSIIKWFNSLEFVEGGLDEAAEIFSDLLNMKAAALMFFEDNIEEIKDIPQNTDLMPRMMIYMDRQEYFSKGFHIMKVIDGKWWIGFDLKKAEKNDKVKEELKNEAVSKNYFGDIDENVPYTDQDIVWRIAR